MNKKTIGMLLLCLTAQLVVADDIVIWQDNMSAGGREYWGGSTLVDQGDGYMTVDMAGTGTNTAFVTNCSVPFKAGDIVNTIYTSSYKDFTISRLYYWSSGNYGAPNDYYTTVGPHTESYTLETSDTFNKLIVKNWQDWRPFVNLTFSGNSIVRPDSQYVWHNDMTDLGSVRAFNATASLANGHVEVTCTNDSSGLVLFEGDVIDIKAGAELRVNFNVTALPGDGTFQDVFLQTSSTGAICNVSVTNNNQYALVYEFTEDTTIDWIYFRPMWGNEGVVQITDAMIIESIPEPATMAVLMLGGAAAFIGRKRNKG